MRDVTFPTHDPFTLTDTERPSVQAATIPARAKLCLPHRPEPPAGHPAIVLMEGLGGLKPQREIQYARDLAEDGFAVLVVDTFGTRGKARLSDTRRALEVTEAMMLADAFGGLRHLRGRSDIDPDRIAVLGFSYGGMIAVLAAHEQIRRLMAPDLAGFAAHVSFYGCSVPRLDDPTATGAPVLMMLGARDRNVSVPRATRIAEDLERGGTTVRRIVYDAWHQWDGTDQEPRFVRHALNTLRVRLDPRNEAWLEGPLGLRMGGPWSRRLAIALGVSFRGYHILRDPEVEARSYAETLRFLDAAMPAGAVPSGTRHDDAARATGWQGREGSTAARRSS